MIHSYFLSQEKHDKSHSHEIIPISVNMQKILQSRYYNTHEKKEEKCIAQTWSQTKSSGIDLPEDLVINKGIDPKILPEKHVIKSTMPSEVTHITNNKPRLGHDRTGFK